VIEPISEPVVDPSPPDADPDPVSTSATGADSPLAALAKAPVAPAVAAGLVTERTPSGPSEPSTPLARHASHDPVEPRTPPRDGGRPKWLVPAGVAAAVILLLGSAFALTRGGDDQQTAIDTGPSDQTTTTSRPATSSTSTTAPPATVAPTTPSTQAPSTSAPVAPTTTGANPTLPVAPPTTRPAAVVANVQYSMSPGTIRASETGSRFEWSVSANGPVTVEVTGPGVSSSAPTGGQTVCSPGSSCGVGTHYFTIVVKDGDGRQVGAGTAKLIVRD
jgi:hypothetical protein